MPNCRSSGKRGSARVYIRAVSKQARMPCRAASATAAAFGSGTSRKTASSAGTRPRSAWIADPLVIDGCFQLAILWCQETRQAPSLPAFLSAYRQHHVFPRREPLHVTFRVTRSGAHDATGDFRIQREDGTVVATIEGYECTVDPSLSAAFGRRALHVDAPGAR